MPDDSPENPSHLSRIETLWSVVRRAHGDEASVAGAAQQQLLELYGGAIRRYLLASLRDPDLADELFQEFAVKFIRGDFRNADPEKGRFRAFVKTSLYRMMALHFRKKKSDKLQFLEAEPADSAEPSAPLLEEDRRFVASWREELLARAWQLLADHEVRTGTPYNTVLRLKVTQPALASTELAEQIGEALGKPTTAGSARVLVHRARDKFAHLLMEVIQDSLGDPNEEALEAELIELGLIDYCRDVLESRRSASDSDPAE